MVQSMYVKWYRIYIRRTATPGPDPSSTGVCAALSLGGCQRVQWDWSQSFTAALICTHVDESVANGIGVGKGQTIPVGLHVD
jgi:hypothetical protein